MATLHLLTPQLEWLSFLPRTPQRDSDPPQLSEDGSRHISELGPHRWHGEVWLIPNTNANTVLALMTRLPVAF